MGVKQAGTMGKFDVKKVQRLSSQGWLDYAFDYWEALNQCNLFFCFLDEQVTWDIIYLWSL